MDFVKLSSSKIADEGISRLFISEDIPAILGILATAFSATDGRTSISSFSSSTSSFSSEPYVRGAQDIAEQVCYVGRLSRTFMSSIVISSFLNGDTPAVSKGEPVGFVSSGRNVRFIEMLSRPQRHWLVCVCIHYLQRRSQHVSGHSVTDILFQERRLMSTRAALTFLLDALELEDEESSECENTSDNVSVDVFSETENPLTRRPIFQALMTSGLEVVVGLEVYIDIIGKAQSDSAIPIHARLLGHLFDILEKFKKFSHVPIHPEAEIRDSTFSPMSTTSSASLNPLVSMVSLDESGLAPVVQPWSFICKPVNFSGDLRSESSSLPSSQASSQASTPSADVSVHRKSIIQRNLSEIYSPSLSIIQSIYTRIPPLLPKAQTLSHEVSQPKKKSKVTLKTVEVVDLVNDYPESISEDVSIFGRKRGRSRKSHQTSTETFTSKTSRDLSSSKVYSDQELRPRIALPDTPRIFSSHSTPAQGALAFVKVIFDAVVVGNERIAAAAAAPATRTEMAHNSTPTTSGLSQANILAQRRFRECMAKVDTVNAAMLRVPDVFIVSDEFVTRARNWTNLSKTMSKTTISLFKDKYLPIETNLFDPSVFFRAGQVISTTMKLLQDYSLFAPSRVLNRVSKEPTLLRGSISSASFHSAIKKNDDEVAVMNIGSSIYSEDNVLLCCTDAAVQQSADVSVSPPLDIKVELKHHLLLSSIKSSISTIPSLSPTIYNIEAASDMSILRSTSRSQSFYSGSGSAPFIKGPLSRLRLPSPWQPIFPILEARISLATFREMQVGTFIGRQRPALSALIGASGIWSQEFIRFYLKRRSLESAIDLCFRALSLIMWPLEIPITDSNGLDTLHYSNLAKASIKSLVCRWGFEDATVALSESCQLGGSLPAKDRSFGMFNNIYRETTAQRQRDDGIVETAQLVDDDRIIEDSEVIVDSKVNDDEDEEDDDDDDDNDDNDNNDNNDDNDDDELKHGRDKSEAYTSADNDGRSVPFSNDKLRVDIGNSAKIVLEALNNVGIRISSSPFSPPTPSERTKSDHLLSRIDESNIAGTPSLEFIVQTLNESVLAASLVIEPDLFSPPATFSDMVSALIRRLVSIDPSVMLPLHEFFCVKNASATIRAVLGIKSLAKIFMEKIAPSFYTDATKMSSVPSNQQVNYGAKGMTAFKKLLSFLHAAVAESANNLPLKLHDQEHVLLPSTPMTRSANVERGGDFTFPAHYSDGSRLHQRMVQKRQLPENFLDAHLLNDVSALRFPSFSPKIRTSVSGAKKGVMLSLPSGTKALLERPFDDSGRKVSIDSLDLVVHVAGFSLSKNEVISNYVGEKRHRLSSSVEQFESQASKRKTMTINTNTEHDKSEDDRFTASDQSSKGRICAGPYDSNFFGSLVVPPSLPYGSVEEVILGKIPVEAVSSFLTSSSGFIEWANSIVNRCIALHPWHIRGLPLKPETDKALKLHPHPLVRRLSPVGTVIFCDICGDTLYVRYNCELCGYDECLPCNRKRKPDLPALVHRKIKLPSSSIVTPTLQEIDAAFQLFRSEGLTGDLLFEAVSSSTRLLDVLNPKDENEENSLEDIDLDDTEQDDFDDLLDREHAASGGGGGEFFSRKSNHGRRRHNLSGEKSSRPSPCLIGGAPIPFHARIVSFDALSCSHRIHFLSNAHEEDVILPLCHYALLHRDLPLEGPSSDFLSPKEVLSSTYKEGYVEAVSIEDTPSSSLDDDRVQVSESVLTTSSLPSLQTSSALPTESSAPLSRPALPKDWSCDACTFINPFASGVCGICGTGQPSFIRVLKEDKSVNNSSDSSEVSWECPRCTVRTIIVRRFPDGPRNTFLDSLKLAVIDVCTMCQTPIPHEVINDAINKQRVAAGLPTGGSSTGFLSSSASAVGHSSAPSSTPDTKLRQHYSKTLYSLLTHLEGLVKSNGSRSHATNTATENFIDILHELPPHLIRNHSGEEVTTTSVDIGGWIAKLGDTIDAVGASGRWLEAIVIAFGRRAQDDESSPPTSSSVSTTSEDITHVLVRYNSLDVEHDRWLPTEVVSLPGHTSSRLVAVAGTNIRDWRYEIITMRENHLVEYFHKGRWVVARVVSIDGVDLSLSRPAIIRLYPRIHINLTYQTIISGVSGEKSVRVKINDEFLAPLGTHLPWPLISSKSSSHLRKISHSSWKDIQDPIREQISKCGVGPALVSSTDLGSLKAVSFLNLRSRLSAGDLERIEPVRRVEVTADDEYARAVLTSLAINKNPSNDFSESKRFLLTLKSGAMHHGCTAYDFATCVSRSALQSFYECLSHSALIMELERKHPQPFPKGQAARLRNARPSYPISSSVHVVWSKRPLRMATRWDEGRASFAYDRSSERPPKPRDLKAGQLFERALGVSASAKSFFNEKDNDERVFHIHLRLRIFGCDDATAWELVPLEKSTLSALQEACCRLLIKSGISSPSSNEIAKELAGAFMQESVAGNGKKNQLPLRFSDGKIIPVSAEAAFCTGLHLQVEPVLLCETTKLNAVISPLAEARNLVRDIGSCEGGFAITPERSSFEKLMSRQALDALELLSKLRDEIFLQERVHHSCDAQEVIKFGKSLLAGTNSLIEPLAAVKSLFINDALTLRCEIQIADTLASSASVLPKWLLEIVYTYPLSLPVSLRKVLLTQAAFGPINLATQIQDQVLLVHDLARAGRAGTREIRYDDFGRPQQNEITLKVLPNDDHVQAYRLVALRGRDSELSIDRKYGREPHSPRGSQTTHSPLGIINRDRAEIHRTDILLEASLMLLLHSKGSGKGSVLNVNFSGEKGSGEGPTQDFFSSVADEIQKRFAQTFHSSSQNTMFYHNGAKEDTHVRHSSGLFPLPVDLSQEKNSHLEVISQRFTLMGRCIGKALKDVHIFPLPLSTQFFALVQRLSFKKRILPTSASNGIQLIRSILWDPMLTSVIEKFIPSIIDVLRLAQRRLHLREKCQDDSSDMISDHIIASTSSFMLDFRDPGTNADLTKVPLVHCGIPGALSLDEALMHEKNILYSSGISFDETCCSDVSFNNVDIYMAKLIAYSSWYGIRLQCHSFVLGLKDVLSDVSFVGGLLPSEIRDLACGSPSVEWTLADLQGHIKLQPGQYTISSQPTQYFFSALIDMNQTDRQDFLRFVTGCPLLPVGGLSSLHPPLTLMQKGLDSSYSRAFRAGNGDDSSFDLSSSLKSSQSLSLYDKVLVSSSTCFHQIKLPPYSSLDVTKEMLRNSIIMSKGLIDMS